MKAIKKNLKDGILDESWSGVSMCCTKCGAEYSANSGDYWNVPDDHKFKCCGRTMILARKNCEMIEV